MLWPRRCEDRLGDPAGISGGVEGGVGPAEGCMNASANVSVEGFTGKAPTMKGKSGGRVSSTMTMDLLPLVRPLVARDLASSLSVLKGRLWSPCGIHCFVTRCHPDARM